MLVCKTLLTFRDKVVHDSTIQLRDKREEKPPADEQQEMEQMRCQTPKGLGAAQHQVKRVSHV